MKALKKKLKLPYLELDLNNIIRFNFWNYSINGGRMESNFNKHLGSKLRMRRLALGLTQTKVAQAINVTFQQIQKYEKGTNGISSLRIMQLATFLNVQVVYFFEDYPGYLNSENKNPSEDLNFSFLVKIFSGLSSEQKEKIFQVLKNSRILDKAV